mmetsp:Transcript_22672/g.69701  ORF Transcript_22672/g.69701 Transcript_22672/m.69701 type:complete len:450 (-) Transcript_22672:126-1475(-)|eukprot:CAMPEP_0198649078 /NCGR_PEP_ID=MMETSP1467-20131203/3991_1 /TAXON_ID=1462469 /ORGANISM="unid. sp., Strain CCMP2135" /LENGTH=449 /DNA_ID=CAMNT_0044384831 /DNA_START=107 /DNA_END=1456 /DNA_ORIENTATION=+
MRRRRGLAALLLVCCATVSCVAGAAPQRQVPQVVLSTDSAQFEGLAAALASLVAATRGQELAVTLVTPQADSEKAVRIAQCAGVRGARVVPWESTNVTRLQMVNASELSGTLKKQWTSYRSELSSILNFVRFYLPEIVPGDGPVLYLDSDVVLRCDVAAFLAKCRETFDANARATILVAPRSDVDKNDKDSDGNKKGGKNRTDDDAAAPTTIDAASGNETVVQGQQHQRRRQLGHVLEEHEQLFNAGVFVADLRRWRERNATGRLEQMFHDVATVIEKNFSAAAWHRPSSQAPMTRVFGAANEYAYLDGSGWNHRMKLRARHPGGDKGRVCLLHFVGAHKPWNLLDNRARHRKFDVDKLHTDLALKPLLKNDTIIDDLPWWTTVWLPFARPCCVDPTSPLCQWHKSLPDSDLKVLNMPRPKWPKEPPKPPKEKSSSPSSSSSRNFSLLR